jgi:tight adherence protein B
LKSLFLILLFIAFAIFAYFYRDALSAIKNRFLSYAAFIERLVKNSVAGVKKSAIARIEAASGAVLLALCAATGAWLLLVPSAAVMFIIPGIYVSLERRRYLAQYRAGLQGFLEHLIAALRSGTSITRALQDFCLADNSPVGREISLVIQKTGLGSSMKEALLELNSRVPVGENEILTAALSTALETGGNLSEVLSVILSTIRQRDSLLREVKALTSQGILSGIIVGALPFLLAGVMSVMDPELMGPLFTTRAGLLMLAAAVMMESLGAFIIYRIVDIKG